MRHAFTKAGSLAAVSLLTLTTDHPAYAGHSNTRTQTTERVTFLSDEEFELQYGADTLTQFPVGARLPQPAASPQPSDSEPSTRMVTPQRGAAWQRVKFTVQDPDGRKIPTRVGNSRLGWQHFSGRHNIRTHRALKAAYDDKVDKRDGHHLEYHAMVIHNRRIVAKVVGVAQYHHRTEDGKYTVPRKE